MAPIKLSESDLREQLAYFEQRLAEAERRSISKEPLPAKFSADFTTENPKTWSDTIKFIKERIASIQVPGVG
jgi:hypothetical protein